MSKYGRSSRGFDRRGFLALSGAAAAAGLVGCDTGYKEPGAAKGKFNIPDPKKKLPSGNIKYRVIDSGDTKKPFWEGFFEAYGKKHSNVEIKYDGMLINRMDEVIPLGIRNGSAPDMFQMPPSITIQKAVGEGWVAPLDDFVPDIEAFKKRFPVGTFAEGQQLHDGKLYQVPIASDQRYYCTLHYNKQMMEKAGYDPAAKQLTVDEFRDAAKKMTSTKGGNQVYGYVLEIGQTNRLAPWVDWMARIAGADIHTDGSSTGISPKNGEFYFDEPEIMEAINVILALKKDGSLFPGSNSLTAPEAWPRVPRGQAGMVTAGPWVTVLWENENPSFKFGISEHPTLVDDPSPAGYTGWGADAVSLYAKSKAKQVSGDMLSYIIGDEGQKRWGEIVKCGNPPIVEKSRAEAAKSYSTQAKNCLKIAEKQVLNPEPLRANPDTALVDQLLDTPVVEDFGAVIQAIVVGKESNPKKALTDLKSRRDKMLDAAIAEAKKKGAKVSREDWVFSNWDKTKDYLPADYKGR